jgi:hypothetical protein
MLSILLPSIHQDSLQLMLGNIFATTNNDYEVVVVSPFEPKFPPKMRGLWVPEEGRLGSSGAQAYAVHFAAGEFIVALSDDVELIRPFWNNEVIHNFKEQERGGSLQKSPLMDAPLLMGTSLVLDMRLDSGGVNAIFGQTYATLPMMRHSTAQYHGWYDPTFFSRHGDSDLSLRIWKAGGCVAWSKEAIVRVHPDNARNGMTLRDDDGVKFLQRWKSHFPDWPNDAAKYDCGIAMDKIHHFPQNFVNYPKYVDYAKVRKDTGH